jgi:hypothetical protein
MASIDSLVQKLEKRVQPKEDDYKFSPDDLLVMLEDSLMEHNPEYDFDTLPKAEESLVFWLAMSQAYLILAGHHAENMRFKIENDEYHGNMPHLHYLEMAEQYRKRYNENKAIQVTTVTRTHVGTGLKVGYNPGDTP